MKGLDVSDIIGILCNPTATEKPFSFSNVYYIMRSDDGILFKTERHFRVVSAASGPEDDAEVYFSMAFWLNDLMEDISAGRYTAMETYECAS